MEYGHVPVGGRQILARLFGHASGNAWHSIAAGPGHLQHFHQLLEA